MDNFFFLLHSFQTTQMGQRDSALQIRTVSTFVDMIQQYKMNLTLSQQHQTIQKGARENITDKIYYDRPKMK